VTVSVRWSTDLDSISGLLFIIRHVGFIAVPPDPACVFQRANREIGGVRSWRLRRMVHIMILARLV
jgi:hypothetical protein